MAFCFLKNHKNTVGSSFSFSLLKLFFVIILCCTSGFYMHDLKIFCYLCTFSISLLKNILFLLSQSLCFCSRKIHKTKNFDLLPFSLYVFFLICSLFLCPLFMFTLLVVTLLILFFSPRLHSSCLSILSYVSSVCVHSFFCETFFLNLLYLFIFVNFCLFYLLFCFVPFSYCFFSIVFFRTR